MTFDDFRVYVERVYEYNQTAERSATPGLDGDCLATMPSAWPTSIARG
jgi:hypothetical protein